MRINWFGWIANIACYLMVVAALLLFLGGVYGIIVSIIIFAICTTALIAQATHHGVPTIVKDEDNKSTFTTEDYVNCKVGEWLTR